MRLPGPPDHAAGHDAGGRAPVAAGRDRASSRPVQDDPTALRGRTDPWGRGLWLLLALVGAGLALRLWALSAEGFGDDEVHKWLAANRYLHGDFGGDDVEHPMLMKVLITAFLAAG